MMAIAIMLYRSQCTFWCSVLSDKNTKPHKKPSNSLNAPSGAQCFPTFRGTLRIPSTGSQCAFWCSVLSDGLLRQAVDAGWRVSMHLLVLSAFRHFEAHCEYHLLGLNAPSGAQCFPTLSLDCYTWRKLRLNAPSGAQCFPTGHPMDRTGDSVNVSMHLLVLSAFRQGEIEYRLRDLLKVSMHLLVLSAFRLTPRNRMKPLTLSQCTFWCSVLSD